MKRLGVGFVGSGFMTQFHVRSFEAVRNADITAIYSRNAGTARQTADLCKKLDVGEPSTYSDLAEMVRDPKVEAIWVAAPNHHRVEMIECIVEEVVSGRAGLTGIAVEKPLARNVKEARQVASMIKSAGLLHGYLENQVYCPAITRSMDILWQRGASLSGSPYLARCAEEHSGPHRPWFWNGAEQGGGVLNDMMCHSIEAGRFMLTRPGEPDWLTPKAVTARIASLKWTRPEYAGELRSSSHGEVDYDRSPAEDYATAQITYETKEGDLVIAEATTSWSFVGAGLRHSFEVLGPEYSMMANTLDTEAKIFLSRRLQGEEGEDLIEKQNAEQGLMPVMSDEPTSYGYVHENRHMVRAFLDGRPPSEGLDDGLLVTELLMSCYMSAQLGKTLQFPIDGIENFIPEVAKGTWNQRKLVDSAWNPNE
ncbi:MAG: Gfo/Idh/MocA family oxidoreductase [Balneolales bacterium]